MLKKEKQQNPDNFEEFVDKFEYLKYLAVPSNQCSMQDIKDIIGSLEYNDDDDLELLDVYDLKMVEIFDVNNTIYYKIFDSQNEKFYKKNINKINQFNITNKITNLVDNKKFRIFFISLHGYTCSISDYKKMERIDYKK